MAGHFKKRKDGTYSWVPEPAKKPNAHLLALSYKQVEHLPDADGKQSRK